MRREVKWPLVVVVVLEIISTFQRALAFQLFGEKLLERKSRVKALTKDKLKESRFKAEEGNRTERGSCK